VTEKIVFCWSGGKDSALALHRLRQEGRYEVVSLLTTCNEHFQRVSMHGVRVSLAERQARAIGVPLDIIYLSRHVTNDEYQAQMSGYLLSRKVDGIAAIAFGDIFLEDLKRWREANLAAIGMRGVFPLWKEPTKLLIEEFLSLGFASIICCVNDAYLDENAVGRLIDKDFIATLPSDVDPCGENGEFHSFAFNGPIFKQAVPFAVGQKVYRPIEESRLSVDGSHTSVCPPAEATSTRGFWFCDLLEC
jgi:uncharacterized protein (TIGR00290 family)